MPTAGFVLLGLLDGLSAPSPVVVLWYLLISQGDGSVSVNRNTIQWAVIMGRSWQCTPHANTLGAAELLDFQGEMRFSQRETCIFLIHR